MPIEIRIKSISNAHHIVCTCCFPASDATTGYNLLPTL